MQWRILIHENRWSMQIMQPQSVKYVWESFRGRWWRFWGQYSKYWNRNCLFSSHKETYNNKKKTAFIMLYNGISVMFSLYYKSMKNNVFSKWGLGIFTVSKTWYFYRILSQMRNKQSWWKYNVDYPALGNRQGLCTVRSWYSTVYYPKSLIY